MKRSIVFALGLSAVVCQTGLAGKAEAMEQTGSRFAEIAKNALPAVVFIDVESTVEVPQYRYHQFVDPFEQFFGRGRGYVVPEEVEPRRYMQMGQGSGFIISTEGYILTNNHVVQDADRITVTLGDGRKFDARLVGTDPESEVAVIKIEDGNEPLPYLEPGDSDALQVGEWVLAAGNPFGLSQSITAGIVSAKNRSAANIAEYGSFIQTDAAINPGNSGGPLLDINGKVVGVNTAIYTRTGGYMGIGFAIPINLALEIKEQLIQHGKVSRSVLGIHIQEVDEDLAKSFGLDDAGGILVAQVAEGSAAAEAGLKAGDIIVEMDGGKAGQVDDFRNRVAATPPGTKVELRVFRNGKYKNMAAVTKARDAEAQASDNHADAGIYDKLGLTVDELDAETTKRLGFEGDDGVLISEVEQGSPAWRSGLQPGQVITSVNREKVGNVQEFRRRVSESGEGGRILMLISDGRSSRFVVVSVE